MSQSDVLQGESSVQQSTQDQWIARGQAALMQNYATASVVLSKGNGCYVEDVNGKQYLDFVSGIAVNSLGHCNSAITQSLTDQLQRMMHCSNLYYNTPQIELAEVLVANSDFDKVFFCNSGTEAVEAAIKLARKFSKHTKGAACTEVISLSDSFHGRTLGALSATGQTKHQQEFQPLLPGFRTVPMGELSALQAAITGNTSAVIIEPIQGEGGVRPIDKEYLQAVRQLCSQKNVVLIFDEIQSGMGRTGSLFAYQRLGVVPDVIVLAKGLGGGFPIGAVLASQNVASAFVAGDHGSTFGGNPLACAAALGVVRTIMAPGFLDSVERAGAELKQGLIALQKSNHSIVDVRGSGLMQGVEFKQPVKPIVDECLNRGLLLVSAGPNVVRFVPSLIVGSKEIRQCIAIFSDVLKSFSC